MRGLDPSIELIAAGSSGRQMETYLEWDRAVLETCWDDIEFISAHRYSSNAADNTPEFLAEGVVIDSILDDYAGLIAYVKGVKKSSHDVYVSFDEWNVWYKARGGVTQHGQWATGPALIEEIYNLEDALVCAQYMNSFIRRADVVKVACLAQLVNVIAAVLTRPDGTLKQSIYYPFALYSKHANGISLTPAVDSPTYDAGDRGEVDFIDASASFDEESETMSLFLVNRSVDQDVTVTIDLSDRQIISQGTVQVMTGDDPKLANTWEQPDNVVPTSGSSTLNKGVLTIDVPKLGMAVTTGISTNSLR